MDAEFIGDQKNVEDIFNAAKHMYDFYILPNVNDLGVINVDQSMENLATLVAHAKDARSKGFYIEFISLKLQFVEFFLRVFYAVKSNGQIYAQNDKKTFGVIINECETVGFDGTLIADLKNFNTHRVNAIHKFILGNTSNQELANACDEYQHLGNIIKNYVIGEVGVKVDKPEEIPNKAGSMLFQIRKEIL